MIRVEATDPTPPSEQVRAQIANQVRSGELTAFARLPSVRQLSADLGLAAGTIAKAYSALEREGLVTTSRGRGTRVAEGKAVDERVRRAANEFIRAIEPEQLTLDEILSVVRAEWTH